MFYDQGQGVDLGAKLPPISIKAEPLFSVGNLFTFTNSMLYTLVVIAGLAIFFFLATRRMRLIPRGAQNFGEAIVELLLGITEGTAGRRVGRRIFPLIATLFIFIITANYSGLLPGVGTIGFCKAVEHTTTQGMVIKTAAPAAVQTEPATQSDQAAPKEGGGLPTDICKGKGPNGESEEFVPFLRAPNADLNTTLAMALLAVGVVQIAGIAAHGFGGYLKELMSPVFLAPIHIIGEISRVISLSFRLFGNIFGGEVLVTVMYALLGSILFGFGTFIFLGLELLFGLIQALIFSILTLVYIATAVAGHGGGGHEAEPAHAGPESPAEEMGQRIAQVLTGRKNEESGPEVPGTTPESGTERHMG